MSVSAPTYLTVKLAIPAASTWFYLRVKHDCLRERAEHLALALGNDDEDAGVFSRLGGG